MSSTVAAGGRAATRGLRLIVTVLAVTVGIGLLPLLAGRDPALAVLRARAAEREPDDAALESVRSELGLDDGPVRFLLEWLAGLARGDPGTSWVSGQPIAPQLVAALGVSLTLAAAAVAVAAMLAAAFATRPLLRGVTGDHGAARSTVPAALAAVPEFLLASILVVAVAVPLAALPTAGWDGPVHAVLPAIALGVPTGAILGTITVDSVRAVFGEPWVRTWRAAGITPARLAPAVLRRALAVVCGQLGLIFAGLLGGAVAVEVVFAVPGIGRLAADAALAQDLPVVQACLLVLLAIGVITGTLGERAQRVLLGPALDTAALTAAQPLPRGRLRGGLAASGLVAALGAAVVIALTTDPDTVNLAARLEPPSMAHPFGTDALGRDLLARLGHGALHTVGVAVAVTAATLAIGLAVGLLNPRRGGGLVDVVNAVPPVMAGLVVAAVAGPGTFSAALAVGCVVWAPLARHAQLLVAEHLAAPHLDGARAVGAGKTWLLTRHVLPAVLPPLLRHSLVRLPAIALALASLGFLGLGAQPPAPEWGRLLGEALPYADRAPWAVALPVLALAVLGAAALALGNRLR
ncbi:ABC transporter permease subunit [Haloechinothrix sp. LS1_15]|uniref:ABC transporter permease subunit n=1 Tax=Haloechinothrix sp. LS1_15 TaxID=2652248 RepID=UPI0029450A35|nr:ABC transporter permease subunit [Haloechinothrix sp. LS1_15]MDV6012901.1 ABC transporter permease subunit [Haloechinothrix sp. LS1_15]